MISIFENMFLDYFAWFAVITTVLKQHMDITITSFKGNV